MSETLPIAKTVLLIEDSADLRSALKQKFTQEGFQFFEAENGRLGLSMALEKHPDIILLDIRMPEMSGLDVLEQLRADDWGKTALVMMLTNSDSSSDISKTLSNHVIKYIVKVKWKIDDIVAEVKEALR